MSIPTCRYRPISLRTSLMIVRPILRSTPCLVRGTPVALAMFLLMTSTPNALRGEKEVPGSPNIIIGIMCLKSLVFLHLKLPKFFFPCPPAASMPLSLCCHQYSAAIPKLFGIVVFRVAELIDRPMASLVIVPNMLLL